VTIVGGLQSGPMSFAEYDPAYPSVFAEVVRLIRDVHPDVRVEHTGSTSVSGLGGRPTLDVVVVAEDGQQEETAARLRTLGLVDFPWAYVKPMLVGRLAFQGKDYQLLVYVLPAEHELLRGFLAFRTYMRRHPEEVQAYAVAKRHILEQGNVDPRSYQAGKTPYLQELAARIGAEGEL
jgi:GrpB-like predicted nucleotidyltransferase (UPF0157 family)